MSVYVMTVGELAKKRGEPVGDFVKKIQAVGFDAGSHAKKLTQDDLDVLIGLLDGNNAPLNERKESVVRQVQNPNVLMLKLPNGKRSIIYVDATINELGKIDVSIVESSTEDTLGDALLQFRKQLGLKLGVN